MDPDVVSSYTNPIEDADRLTISAASAAKLVRTHMKRHVKPLQMVRRAFGGLGSFGVVCWGGFGQARGVPMP